MAKRYHQSKKDKRDERTGEMKHLDRIRLDRLHESIGEERYVSHERNLHNDSDRNDRAPERVGERQYEYRMNGGAEYYAGMEPRRRQEMRDAGMITEDHRAIANMPQEVRYHAYPRVYGYLPEDLDDTLRGVDRQMDLDNDRKMRHYFPKKV